MSDSDQEDFNLDDCATNRQKLNSICSKLGKYCRNQHERTHKIIDLFIQEFVSKDKELLEFFRECYCQYSDPRMNPIFQEEWPNLNFVTEDDENTELEAKIEKFVKVIPILYQYSSYL